MYHGLSKYVSAGFSKSHNLEHILEILHIPYLKSYKALSCMSQKPYRIPVSLSCFSSQVTPPATHIRCLLIQVPLHREALSLKTWASLTQVGDGGGGVLNKILCGETPPGSSNSYPLIYQFSPKWYPFYTPK